MEQKKWHTIIDGQGVPETCDPVVGFWIGGGESYVAICFYDPEDKRWQDCEQTKKGTYQLKEPDYWVELPDYWEDDNEG